MSVSLHNLTSFDPYLYFPVSKKELDDVDYLNWSMGLPCTALMVLFFIWLAYCVDTKKLKLTPSQWLIVGLAIALCGCSFSFFISVFNQRFINSYSCIFQGVLSIYFGYATLFWMACLSLNFRIMLVPKNGVFNKTSPVKLYKYFWLFSFGVPVILVAWTYAVHAAGPNGNVCWFYLTPEWQLFRGIIFHGVHLAVMAFNSILIIQIMRSLRQHYRGTQAGVVQGNVKQARVYIGILVVLGVAWIAIIPVDVQELMGNLTGGAFFYCICIHLFSVHLQALMVCTLEFFTLGLHKHLYMACAGVVFCCAIMGGGAHKIDPRMSAENDGKGSEMGGGMDDDDTHDEDDDDGSNRTGEIDVPYDVVSRQELDYMPPHPQYVGSNTDAIGLSPLLSAQPK